MEKSVSYITLLRLNEDVRLSWMRLLIPWRFHVRTRRSSLQFYGANEPAESFHLNAFRQGKPLLCMTSTIIPRAVMRRLRVSRFVVGKRSLPCLHSLWNKHGFWMPLVRTGMATSSQRRRLSIACGVLKCIASRDPHAKCCAPCNFPLAVSGFLAPGNCWTRSKSSSKKFAKE